MKKKGILFGGIALGVIAIVVICVIIFGGKDAYRTVKVFEVSGKAIVTRDGKQLDAVKNMNLRTGDSLETGSDSFVRLKLDDDKFVYLEHDSYISLVAEGTAADSKTIIYLEKGEMLTEVQNKLSTRSSYDVVTPNTTMAIRGTKTLTTVEKCDVVALPGYSEYENSAVDVASASDYSSLDISKPDSVLVENADAPKVSGIKTNNFVYEGKVEVSFYHYDEDGNVIYEKRILNAGEGLVCETPDVFVATTNHVKNYEVNDNTVIWKERSREGEIPAVIEAKEDMPMPTDKVVLDDGGDALPTAEPTGNGEAIAPTELPDLTESVEPTGTPTETPEPTEILPEITEAPTPTEVPMATPEPTATKVPTATPIPTKAPMGTKAPTATPMPTKAPTGTKAPTATPIPTKAPMGTKAPTATPIPTKVPTVTMTPTVTPMPTATPVPTATPTVFVTATPTPYWPFLLPTNSPTPAPTSTPTPTLAPLLTSTPTPVPTSTPTATPVPTSTPTATPVPTSTPTATPVPTSTPTATPVPTNTPTPLPRRDDPTPTPELSPDGSPVSTPTPTPYPVDGDGAPNLTASPTPTPIPWDATWGGVPNLTAPPGM